MGYTKEKRLINAIVGKPTIQKRTPVATDMFLPNHSGDHSAGLVNTTPTNDTDIVNKKYVDDEISGITHPIEDGTAAGQMAFWNGTTWTYTATSELYWDDTWKSLRIGTTTVPVENTRVKLHTKGPTDHNYTIYESADGWVTTFISGTSALDHAYFFDKDHDYRILFTDTITGGNPIEAMRWRKDGTVGHTDHIFTMKDDGDVSYFSTYAEGTGAYSPGWVSFFGSNRYNPAMLWSDGDDLRFLANADNQKGGTTTEF